MTTLFTFPIQAVPLLNLVLIDLAASEQRNNMLSLYKVGMSNKKQK